jgi:hypothetical protein
VTGKGVLYGATALQVENSFRRDLRRSHPKLQQHAVAEIRKRSGEDPFKMNHAQRAAWYQELGTEIVREHLGATLLVSISGALQLLACGPPEFLMKHGFSLSEAYLGGLPLSALLIAVMLIGLREVWRLNRSAAVLAVTVTAYFIGVSSGPESVYRLLIPASPYLALFLAAGAAKLMNTAPDVVADAKVAK